ncbi:branched-chain amino acid ABC transporter permease [Plantactinospora sonchi]|uniref:Branched-chain amino acid ABC transporter permease n=1 Tax=Plantactinospora sonchi TaxID=1544735 RepID=A0ABU7S3G9_9ACTN
MSSARRRRLVQATAVGVLALAVAVPWLTDPYTTSLLARTLVLGLVGVSVALLTGVAGLPTLGQTGPYAAGAYAGALVGLHVSSVGVVQVLTGAAAGALFAALAVPLVVYARGVVVLMITLAIGELTVTAASRWRSVTGGSDGLAGMPAIQPVWGMGVLDSDRARYLYTLVVVSVVVAIVLMVLRTPAGLLLRATRDDEARMRASGHPVTGYLATAFVAGGAVAGVAGSLLVTAQQYLSPADFGFDVSALLLLGVVIGGATSIGGAIAGTALVIAVRDWVSGQLPGHAPLLLGGLFVLTAYLFPRGVAGSAAGIATLLRSRARNRSQPDERGPDRPPGEGPTPTAPAQARPEVVG